VSDLKEVDLEQAAEVGFLAVQASPAFEEAINATKREQGSKFGGPTTEIFENGNQFNLTYTFEKPILIQGYMLQTADDEPEWDPKSWKVMNKDGEVLHSVEDENQKDRSQENSYRLDDEGVWTDQIQINVSQTQGGNNCHFARFQILTSERVIVENTEDREPWEFIPDMQTERLTFNKL
jgi:hypothetical protein